MEAFETLQERLTRLRPDLPPQLQKAAGFLLENPARVATESMRSIAESSGVALPNFPRLAKAVGFEKYNDLREVYRRQVRLGGAQSYPARADRLQSSGKASGDEAVRASFRDAALANIENTYDGIDAKAIAAIAAKLLKKHRIHVAGLQASQPFAAYFDYVGGMISPDLQLLGGGRGLPADELVDMGRKDAMICLALQPCASATVVMAEQARKRGVFVLGITDSRAAPLAAVSSEVLLTPCESPLFFQSYIGAVAVLELLLGFMTLRAGPGAVKRIAQIEADRRDLGEYWSGGKRRR